ncbi:FitA-like ribbon-helix-helix domain-containing protein [Kribbella sp. NPDC054772]|jgi:plasmid stability protein
MAAITVRSLDDDVKHRLRVRAAEHGRSMEAEVRAILMAAVAEQDEPKNWLLALHERCAAIGGVELDIPPRTGGHRAAVNFD